LTGGVQANNKFGAAGYLALRLEFPMKARSLAILATAFLLGAAAAQDDAKGDKGKLQGTWIVLSAEQDGKPSDKAKGNTFTFSAEKVTFSHPKKREAAYELDSSQKPKHITIKVKLEIEGIGQAEGVVRGIYQLDGDTLKICIGGKDTHKLLDPCSISPGSRFWWRGPKLAERCWTKRPRGRLPGGDLTPTGKRHPVE
jgi:uncharacterized protein (TIGR03067 family)